MRDVMYRYRTVYMRLTCEELDSPKPSNRSVAQKKKDISDLGQKNLMVRQKSTAPTEAHCIKNMGLVPYPIFLNQLLSWVTGMLNTSDLVLKFLGA